MKTATQSKRLLLIEDNEQDEILTLKAFSKSKTACDIEVRRDGEKAMDYFADKKSESTKPFCLDLVLLDLNLPKFSGFEVLKKIRSNHGTMYIPIVVLSTSSDPADIRLSYELGANSYIKKPVDYKEFTDLVGLLNDYWLERNQCL